MHQVTALAPVQVVWVTSGAIAAGSRLQKFKPQTLTQKQALSAIGQVAVMDLYNRELARVRCSGAQILLSPRDLKDPASKRLFVKTVRQLLKWKVLPILNENDAVADAEIRFGDNDQLSSQVAIALGARRLILLSDIPGVRDEQGSVLTRIDRLTPALIRSWVKRSPPGQLGSGGMRSKLLAARAASQAGIDVVIGASLNKNSGTLIPARR